MCVACGRTCHHDDPLHNSGTVIEALDAPDSLSANYVLSVGQTFDGYLDNNDADIVAIDLVAGETYSFEVSPENNFAPTDTVLSLLSSAGATLAFDDDGGTGLYSKISFTATYTGRHYLEVTSEAFYSSNYTSSFDRGNYLLTTSSGSTPDQSDVLSYTEIADYVATWSGQYSPTGFNVSPGGSISVNINALTASGQSLAESALEAWTLVSGINFTFTNSSNAQITFDDNQSGAFANLSFSGSYISSSNVNVSVQWVNDYGTSIDSYSFQTYLHEIGHAIGLGHSGPYNYDGTPIVYGTDNAYANDSWQATVMSYFSQTENTTIDADYAYIITPMISDIIAIQTIYGTAGTLRTGNTTYGHNSNAGGLYDDLTGYTDATAFTIIDEGGSDTLDFSNSSDNQRIDLAQEGISDVLGLEGNLAIANGTTIENAFTGSGADTIIGNDAANIIDVGSGADTAFGNGGNDTFLGANGADSFSGDSGSDTVDYSQSTNAQTINLATNVNVGGLANGDILTSVENVVGSDTRGDKITGSTGDNELYGQGAGDILRGFKGDDNLFGGLSNDYLYGGEGADALFGDGGIDWAMYNDSSQGVTADLTGSGIGGFAQGDTYTDIENIRGSGSADNLTGNAATNKILGDAGHDTIDGAGGRDNLRGGNGADTLIGGSGTDGLRGDAGNDVFVFRQGSDVDNLLDFDDFGNDRVDLSDFDLSGYSAVSSALTQTGGDVRLDLGGGDVLIFRATSLASIGSDDFIL